MMTIAIKGLILLFMAFILYSLGSALYYLMREPSRSTKVVKALSWRIGLSLVLFLLLLVAYSLGWIVPHSISVN